jgi:acetyl-CoA acetyltransferase
VSSGSDSWAPAAYAERAARYLERYGRTTADFGLAAVNSRSNAIANPGAAFRDPLDLEGHAAARIVSPPLGLLDMDAPVDGADAFVITSADRAADLPGPAVLVHAAAAATHHPQDGPHQETVTARLRAQSDLWLDDIDVYYPYDGFSLLVCTWIEAAGWCAPGEAGDFMRTHWDKESDRIMIGGRIPVNSHGGSLSEGGSQGSGHLREAVIQLQGRAGPRQVAGARTALVTPGGLFVNAHGFVLRRP